MARGFSIIPARSSGLDLELKQLVERTGDTGTLGSLAVTAVKQALESLRDRALKTAA